MSGRPDARWLVKSCQEAVPRLYQTKEYSDCTFVIGSKEFPIHKFVLAARSSEFQRILLDKNVEEKIYIENESITATGFEILIRFIYTGEMGTEDKRSIIEAFIAAEYFDQWTLKAECARRFISWPIAEDVWQVLDAGFNISALREKYLAFIKRNVNECLFYASFLNISFGCLNVLLESGILKGVPSLQRISRILEMAAKHQTEPVNYEFVRQSFEKNKPPLLGKLGIETLNMDELATFTDSYDGFLTNDEAGMFLKYSRKKDASCLPTWCKPTI